MKHIKKLFIALMLIMVTLLTSCTSARINQLKKVKFETEDSYVIFSRNYLSNKSKATYYSRIFNITDTYNIGIFHVSNYAYLSCESDKCFHLAKYDLKTNKYVTKKYKFGESINWHYYRFDGEHFIGLLYNCDNKTYYAYSIDLDFNMEKYEIYKTESEYTVSTLYSDYGLVFRIKDFDGNAYTLRSLKVLKDNKLETIEFNNQIEYAQYDDLFDKYYIQYNYVYGDATKDYDILYVYDLEEKRVIYSTTTVSSQEDYSTYQRICAQYNDESSDSQDTENITTNKLEEKSEAYNQIKKIYNSSDNWFPYVREYDGNKYIIVRVYYNKEVNNIWGQHYTKEVDEAYTIYAYDEENDTIKYIGFSMAELRSIIKK